MFKIFLFNFYSFILFFIFIGTGGVKNFSVLKEIPKSSSFRSFRRICHPANTVLVLTSLIPVKNEVGLITADADGGVGGALDVKPKIANNAATIPGPLITAN